MGRHAVRAGGARAPGEIPVGLCRPIWKEVAGVDAPAFAPLYGRNVATCSGPAPLAFDALTAAQSPRRPEALRLAELGRIERDRR